MRGLPRRDRLSAIINFSVVLMVITGVIVLFLRKVGDGKSLTTVGAKNIKYFTTQSNLLCGFVSAYYLVLRFGKKKQLSDAFVYLKLACTSTISITFLVTACILAPHYGYLKLYRGQGFLFHLVVPLLVILDFCLLDTKNVRMKMRYTWMSVFPTLIYGIGYIWNLWRNGMGDTFPDPHDFYKFTTYGYNIAMVVFGGILVAAFIMACLFRHLNIRSNIRNRI